MNFKEDINNRINEDELIDLTELLTVEDADNLIDIEPSEVSFSSEDLLNMIDSIDLAGVLDLDDIDDLLKDVSDEDIFDLDDADFEDINESDSKSAYESENLLDSLDASDIETLINGMSDEELLDLAEKANLMGVIQAESNQTVDVESLEPKEESEEFAAGIAVSENDLKTADAAELQSDVSENADRRDMPLSEENEENFVIERIGAPPKSVSAPQKKKKRKKSFFSAMLVFFSVFFVFSAYKVVSIKLEMKKAADTYNQLSEEFHQEIQPDPEKGTDEPVITNAQRFAPLIEINGDLAAWIYIDGTNINYPVMLPSDQEYYLSHDFYGNYSINGTPFIGKDCNLKSDNIIIYGHCMKDGSMFNNLLNYEDWDFYNTHRSFQIDTVDGTFQYDIVAVFLERIHRRDEEGVFRYYNYTGSLTKQSYDEYVDLMRSVSYYDTGIVPQHGQQLITLSTCHYSDENARLVVVGVLR